MKTLYIYIISIFISFQTIAQDFWIPLNIPGGNTGVYTIKGNSLGHNFLGANGIFKSTDNGLNWSPTNFTSYASSIDINLQNDDIFAGGHGIFFSNDNGENWNKIYQIGAINIFLNSNNYLFIGHWGYIYKINYSGSEGNQVLFLDNTQLITSIVENIDGTMFAGVYPAMYDDWGVYRSHDNGDTWEPCGLFGEHIHSLAANSQGVLFAGSRTCWGLFRSFDNGDTWDHVANDAYASSIVITPDDVIYVGCHSYNIWPKGVFRSFDNGENWEPVNSGLESLRISGLTLSPDGYLYAYGDHLHRSVNPVIYTIDATANPPDGGTVTGAGKYHYGNTAELTATSNTGYDFINWTDEYGNVLTADSIYSFVVEENMTLTANFQLQQFEISAEADPPEGGTITGAGKYYYGDTAELIATSNTGYDFINWTDEYGNVLTADSIYSFVVEEDRNLTANFQLQQFEISAEADPPEGGTITGAGEYYYGDTAKLTATTNEWYVFINWTDEEGNVLTADSIYSFVVEEDRTLTANFQLQQFEISAEVDPTEGGTITGAGEYYYGDTAELIATSNTGYDFINWTDEEENILTTDSIYSFVVESDRKLTANFDMVNIITPEKPFYDISLFPNPFTGVVTVRHSRLGGEAVFTIYTVKGSEVFKSKISGNSTAFDLSHLQPGVYIYSVRSTGYDTHRGYLIKN